MAVDGESLRTERRFATLHPDNSRYCAKSALSLHASDISSGELNTSPKLGAYAPLNPTHGKAVYTLKYVSSHRMHMTNITLSIPDDIRERMRKHPEIKWSEVVRRAILEYLDKLMGSDTLEPGHYVKLAEKAGVNLDAIPLDWAKSHYEKMREMEWERSSTTRTSS
jgi:hypothetical protein